MRVRIAKYRPLQVGPADNPSIGCILLAEPFFFRESEWISAPSDFSLNIVQGKSYDSDRGTGKVLWGDSVEFCQRLMDLVLGDHVGFHRSEVLLECLDVLLSVAELVLKFRQPLHTSVPIRRCEAYELLVDPRRISF